MDTGAEASAMSTDAQLQGRLVHKVVLTGGTAYSISGAATTYNWRSYSRSRV